MSLVDIGGARAQLVAPHATDTDGYLLAVQPFLADATGLGVDAARGNSEATLLASAARSASNYTAEQSNVNARGVLLALNISAHGGGAGIRPYVYAVDPISGGQAQMWVGSYQTTSGLKLFLMCPGASTAGGLAGVVGQALPRRWKVLIEHGDAASHTYSLAACLIV